MLIPVVRSTRVVCFTLPVQPIRQSEPDDFGNDWYADFFTEVTNEFWRRMATPEMTAADIAFLVEKLPLTSGAAILDAPCGSGRHSIALARLGHRVTGIDVSAEAITFARRAAAAEGVDVSFQVGDMRSVPLTTAFDAAVCLGNSFGYLDIAGTRAFLAALAQAIRPGGALVIDANICSRDHPAGLHRRGPDHMRRRYHG